MKNIQNNNGKKQKKNKKKVQTHGQGLGRGLAGDMGLNFLFFLVFPWFFAVWPKPQEHKKNKVQTHGQGLGYPHTNQKTKKPKNQETKKPKNQKTKNNKKTKKTRPNTLHLTPSPWGVQSWFFCCFLLFFGFLCFLVFWFFGFLVCVWIAQTLPMGLNFLFFLFFFVFSRFWPNCKKPWKNQKTKKTRNQKTKKNKIAHPKGRGSDAECWVLSFCFFFCWFLVFWFFGLDSHCRCAKQRLQGTVSGCTRSKVDTLQYSNVCYDIVHSANEQQRGMEFNFVRLRHMLLDLCTGNAAICALPQWPVLFFFWEENFWFSTLKRVQI